jgi:hypothetical protein
MARKRKNSDTGEGVVEGRDIIPQDYLPASPRRNPTHSLKVWNGSRFATFAWTKAFAAKKAVDFLIGEDEYKWLDNRTIITDSGIKIKSDELEDIMEHEFSKSEQEWDFAPHDQDGFALRAMRKSDEDLVTERKERNVRTAYVGDERPKASRKEKGSSKPRASRDGLVTIQAICEELGIDPRDARRVLRGSKTFQKGESGWAWPEGQADEVRKFLGKQKWK